MIITYIKKDNTSSIRASEKTGFTRFKEILVLKIMFFNRKKFKWVS